MQNRFSPVRDALVLAEFEARTMGHQANVLACQRARYAVEAAGVLYARGFRAEAEMALGEAEKFFAESARMAA